MTEDRHKTEDRDQMIEAKGQITEAKDRVTDN